MSLTALAAIAGAAMLWVVRRFSDRGRVVRAKRQIRARLYAIRLYSSEPALVFRAQRELLEWNARYLLLMLRPAALMILPALALFTGLDNLYGHRPLVPGESAVVTAAFGDGVGGANPVLEGGSGIVVETPIVRLPDRREACWRVRPAGAASGQVVLRASGVAVSKAVDTGPELRYVAGRRFVSLRGPVRWIEVAYPAARLRILGYDIPWPVWFVAVSLLSAIVVGWAHPGLRL